MFIDVGENLDDMSIVMVDCDITHVLTLVFIPVICLMLSQMQYVNAARLDLILQRGL